MFELQTGIKLRCWSVLTLLAFFVLSSGASDVFAGNTSSSALTKVGQLRSSSAENVRSLPIDLEGTVLWVDLAKRGLILQDDTGTELFDLEVGSGIVPGTKISLRGTCFLSTNGYSFFPIRLIDNDGSHTNTFKSASVMLGGGKHRIRVDYFNNDGEAHLGLAYEGPNLPMQQIPGSSLFRMAQPGTTNWVNGLDFRAFEGTWDKMPDFSQMRPVKTGTVANFVTNPGTKDSGIGLEFSGWVSVPTDGCYTFCLNSDDGSRFYVYPESPVIRVLGNPPLPPPVSVFAGQVLDQHELAKWAAVEGRVTFASQRPNALELDLSSGASHMLVEVAEPEWFSPDLLIGSRIRAVGTSVATFSPDGQRVAGQMTVFRPSDLIPLELSRRQSFSHPVATLSNLLSPHWATSNDVVHLTGRVCSGSTNKTLILDDYTGRITVETAQAIPEEANLWVDMLARRIQAGTNIIFRSGIFVPLREEEVDGDLPAHTLTSIEQIKMLDREQADLKYPVKIRGVLTDNTIIQDESGSIYFFPEFDDGSVPQIGECWELQGQTGSGSFAPVIHANRGRRLGWSRMPLPVQPTRDQLINGSLDTMYVEIKGIISSAENGRVEFITAGGKVKLGMSDRDFMMVKKYEFATVRLRGCLYSLWDSASHQLKLGEMTISNVSIAVDELPAQDPFALPTKKVSDLLLYDSLASAFQRAKVSGQFLGQRNGESYLMDGTNGLRAQTRSPVQLNPGQIVEVVGLPDLEGTSPLLREALVRPVGQKPLPEPISLDGKELLNSDYDAQWVSLSARLVNVRISRKEQVFELQSGPRSFLARLPLRVGQVGEVPFGAVLKLVGVYVGQGESRSEKREMDSFEVLLNRPSDVTVIERPSWWDVKHTASVGAGLIAILLVAAVWIKTLRRTVDERTRDLKQEIEERKRTEAQLAEKRRQLEEKTELLEEEIEERTQLAADLIDKKNRLEREIDERKRIELEKERIHKELLETSRRAGMAEIATGVLHNVGNVLNSVNVSLSVAHDKVRQSKSSAVSRLAGLINEHISDLPEFLTQDERGRKLPTYVTQLATALEGEQREVQKELELLRDNIEHIKQIVTMQQTYARVSGVRETVSVTDLVEDAIKMHAGAYMRHSVNLCREFQPVPALSLEKHKVLQILVNFLHNAKYACDASERPDKQVTVRVFCPDAARIRIEVADNGIGIPPENLAKIFNHGFTTRKGGHGFGLHSGALAAKELGGAITVVSDGVGKGATFSLELSLPDPRA